jgi:glycosyltransferase involved in cell wall biosynthesis
MSDSKKSANKRAISDVFVSAVVPADNFAYDVAGYVKDLSRVLAANYSNYEVLVVDNGLAAEQIKSLTELLNTIPCLRVLRLSRRHIKDAAVFSGLESSIGDYVCVMNPTLDPPDVIIDMIASNRSGIDIVQGVSTIPIDGKVLARWGRALFYWYNRKFLDTEIPLNATYLVSFNRRAVNALTNTNRNHRYVRQMSRHIGFKLDAFEYKPLRHPHSDKTLRTGMFEALEIITSVSAHPIRFVAWIGVIAAITNLLYACYVVIIRLFATDVAEGWTTLSLQSSLMFFILFIIMAVLAEYVGRILAESRQEPPYHIMEELTSTVAIADTARRNITN